MVPAPPTAASFSDDGDYAWVRMAGEVTAAANAIDDAPVHLVGHSMGGAAGLLAAATTPALFASAYLFEPIVVDTPTLIPTEQNPMAAGARRRPQHTEADTPSARRT